MLESLTIRQIALIDQVTIHFHGGMQVLTGETGAGKSIVVDSVNLILGGRADRDLIRSGCENASVEAVFSTHENEKIRQFMKQENIEYDGSSVHIYREISNNGKNVCRIGGVMLPVSKLRDLAPLLLDIHGQNEHQFLADPDRQLSFLDQTGDESHKELLSKIRQDYEIFIENHRAYAKLVRQNENRESRMKSLEHDLEELRKAGIRAGEADHLMNLRKRLAEAEKTAGILNSIRDMITGGEEGGSCLNRIKAASEAMRSLQIEKAQELGSRCDSLYYELEDIAYQISQMIDKEEFDPLTLERTDNRLDMIHRMERKYGTDADQFPDLLKKTEEEYSKLAELDEQIIQMSGEHKRLLGIYRNTARELTESRKKLASLFEKRMIHELEDLGMGNTRFQVFFIPSEHGRPLMPTEHGDDHIEFMISPNPGEPLKPLAKTASGGELSRMMLAVKTLESSHSGVESMIFDEIDTGISGRMAQVVAEKMITISRSRQVICVTHLPQIAAAADYHFLVQKEVYGSRTNTSVTELDRAGRVSEVSRMISGADGVTMESNTYASQMIRASDEKKKKT